MSGFSCASQDTIAIVLLKVLIPHPGGLVNSGVIWIVVGHFAESFRWRDLGQICKLITASQVFWHLRCFEKSLA